MWNQQDSDRWEELMKKVTLAKSPKANARLSDDELTEAEYEELRKLQEKSKIL